MTIDVYDHTSKATQIVTAKPIMSVPEAQAMEKRHAQESDYYAVLLEDDRTDALIRVRTPAWRLDAERIPVLDANGQKILRNPHEVALDVWAAYGPDEYTLKCVMHGGRVIATPQSIANDLAMGQTKRVS